MAAMAAPGALPTALRTPRRPLHTAVAPQPGSRRCRRAAPPCRAASGSGPWRFDDLSGAGAEPISGLTSFEDLWLEQVQTMDRAQKEVADVQRQMDQRFEAARRELQQAEQQAGGGGMQQLDRRQGGPCSYRWQRSVERSGPGGTYQEYRSESFVAIGVAPPHGCGMHGMAPTPATHFGPLAGFGLLLVAAVAGFWAAATAAFNRRFHLTTYREKSRWQLLLLWPILLLISAEFRTQFWAAVRGSPAAAPGQRPGGGSSDAPDFGMPAGKA